MMNLEADQESGKKLPVIWDSFIGGLLTSSEELNQQRRLPQQQQLGGDIVLHPLSRTVGTAGRCALRQAPHS